MRVSTQIPAPWIIEDDRSQKKQPENIPASEQIPEPLEPVKPEEKKDDPNPEHQVIIIEL